MAAFAFDPADVNTTDTSLIRRGIASTAITAGMALYERSTGAGRYGRCFAGTTATTLADERTCKGIALHAAAVGQPIAFIGSGSITLSDSTMTVAARVVVSSTLVGGGGLDFSSALGSGDFSLFVGITRTAALLDIQILNSTAVTA